MSRTVSVAGLPSFETLELRKQSVTRGVSSFGIGILVFFGWGTSFRPSVESLIGERKDA